VWKKEQFLHRSILTGLFVCILSAGLPAVASAGQTGELGASVVAVTAVTSASDAAEPTDGADLAMWNAAPSKADEAAAATTRTVSPARVTRVLNVQRLAGGIAERGAVMASNLTKNAMKFLGVPYAFGGTSSYGFDCSGYTQHVFAMMGVHLPRMADEQYYAGKKFSGKPRVGDLVFFHTYAPGVSHVGISLGNGRFVHASSSRGVTVSSLHDSYWGPRYVGAKRIVN
jgi:cell wall-associated NlpC family hydrolase